MLLAVILKCAAIYVHRSTK